MKHLLQSLLCLSLGFLSLASFAQRADTMITKTWENGAWVNQSKSSMSYNADCNVDSLLIQMWDDQNGWQNAGLTTYTYVSGSYINTALYQGWTGTKWQDAMRMTYSYTADFKIDTLLIELNILKWTNSTRTIYTYNANGYLDMELNQSFAGNKWSNTTQNFYTYNADGTTDSILVQQWKANAWENLTSTKYAYNADKTVSTTTTQQWIGGAWQNSEKVSSSYSGGKLTSDITEIWENGAWVNDSKTEYSYNASGELSVMTGFVWNGTDWENDNQTTFSYTSSCTLPLTLLDFNLSKSNEAVLLKWETANEVNTKGFNIQRSKDGINFSTIGFVPSAGGAKLNNYSYSDKITSEMSGKQFYRLQMMDNDGKYTLSKALYAVLDQKGSLSIYPNPVKDRLVFVTDNNLSDLNVRITDQNGRVVLNSSFKNVSSGQQNVLDVSRLNKGVYIIQLNGNNYTQSSKFIKY